ncbi:MAG TPA: TIM44-like domain-containing protein [Bacteroidia bacterium]|nr:TIM44-like domain-containing protein [Bacteroidia bacterium]
MKFKRKDILLLLVFIFFVVIEAYSRAGGGGGSHSSGGGNGFGGSGGGGGFGTGVAIGWLLGSGLGRGVLVIIIIAFLVYQFYLKKNSGGTDLVSGSSSGPQGTPAPIAPSFLAANTGFNEQAFIQKINTAFLAIQDAWMNKNLSKVRKWISDGVYQRFNAQFTMMNMLEQVNTLSNINIRQIRIESANQEGAYSIITASVFFSVDDKFICKTHPEFNETFNGDTATEYWTFIKKTSAAEKDLYHSDTCPKCGYPTNQNAGQVSKCESCGTVTYLGDYDWVLCEITQEEDYDRGNYRLDKSAPDIQPLYADATNDFCIQLMEDKASNAVMQYFVSRATQDLKYVHRFTDDTLFASIEAQVKSEGKFVFNRLYLNDVNLISCILVNNVWMASFNIFYSSMRLQLVEGKLQKIDDTVIERSLALTLAKKAGTIQKSKLWSHECPSCGAPYTDTTITECAYCSAKINSTDNDWVMVNLSQPS